jgi:predicted regulator of Ras-like GTPase activity (Roadblock/LC7/MglB family)
MKDVREALSDTITRLRSLTDMKAAAIVRRDGVIVAHDLPASVDPKVIAAMTAAIVGTAEMATVQLGQGRFFASLLESEQGKLISVGAGQHAILSALVHKDANLGLVLMALEKAARRIDEVLKEGMA